MQNYLRSLDLKINRKETVEYKIKFPLPAILPKLIQIRFNENIICSSSSGKDIKNNFLLYFLIFVYIMYHLDGFLITTILVLEHTASGHISFDTDIAGVHDAKTSTGSRNNNYSPPLKNEYSTYM